MAKHVSRRNFMGGMAAAVGYLSTRPSAELWAQGGPAAVAAQRARGPMTPEQYDRMAKLSSNENNFGIARLGDEGDERRLEVRQPLRLP